MKAIGGYFELECGREPLYYQDGIYLNICRSALRYLIRALGIKKIHVPVFTCHVVNDSILQEGCKIETYRLNRSMMPDKEFPLEDYIIYNNYFGVIGNNVKELALHYPNLIVDNAQAFYSQPKSRATVYSPRKFFGLPDGGILRGEDIPTLNIEQGHSFEVSSHLLKRIDFGAQAAYADFTLNDNALEQYHLEQISNLTLTLMGNIDYELVKKKRLDNFNMLHQFLSTDFFISMAEDDVPLVYPLLVKDGNAVREKLIKNQIFCARYWPNVFNDTNPSELEYELTTNLIHLPIDQRYGIEDMNRIIGIINSIESEC